MKILIVSWFFPPSNTIGALRVGAFASFMHRQGHDVRVLTAENPPHSNTLSVEFPEECVVRAPWFDVNAPPTLASRAIKRTKRWVRREPSQSGANDQTNSETSSAEPSKRTFQASLTNFYVNLTNFPDFRVGWYPASVKAGRRMIDHWKPDLIMASGPPFTTLMVGDSLSRRYRIPLVLEFRDRWSDDPYYPPPPWRSHLEKRLERRWIRQAHGLVTVSDPWATDYRTKHQKPTAAILNGYDPARIGSGPFSGSPDVPYLKILYTGWIYPGRRDPSPLFEALRLLRFDENQCRIEFYRTDRDMVIPLAEKVGVANLVSVHPEVQHEEALRLQREADILLLMQWNDSKEQGNIPGKLFEYLGSRRPILGLGLEEGVPAKIIRSRGAGYFNNDPQSIAKQLQAWLDMKRETGSLPELPKTVLLDFSRDEQFSKLEEFLIGLT